MQPSYNRAADLPRPVGDSHCSLLRCCLLKHNHTQVSIPYFPYLLGRSKSQVLPLSRSRGPSKSSPPRAFATRGCPTQSKETLSHHWLMEDPGVITSLAFLACSAWGKQLCCCTQRKPWSRESHVQECQNCQGQRAVSQAPAALLKGEKPHKFKSMVDGEHTKSNILNTYFLKCA